MNRASTARSTRRAVALGAVTAALALSAASATADGEEVASNEVGWSATLLPNVDQITDTGTLTFTHRLYREGGEPV